MYLESSQMGSFYYQWENFINYSIDYKKSTFSVLGGMSYINAEANNLYVDTNELERTLENFRYIDYSTSTANDHVAGTTLERRQIAYYGRASWSYDNKYNIQFNFRADSYDASKLDLENSWGYFPSVSAGWTITNEQFMGARNTDLLSFLKLRASYGKNGSISNLSDYMYSSALLAGANALGTSTFKYYMNNKLYTGVYPDNYLANPKLRWEESVQLDLGVDLRLFKDRLTFAADYYNKNTDGLLVLTTATLTTGTNYQWKNAGIINNKGLEFDLGWEDNVGKLKYKIRGNIGTVSNNVDEYLGENVRFGGTSLAGSVEIPLTYFEEGYPIWYLRGFKVTGINEADGRPIYEDISKDGEITDADKTYIGDGVPDFTYGITLNLEYRNFDFVIFGTGSNGADLFYGVSNAHTEFQNRPKFLYDDRWTTDHTIASRPSAFYQNDSRYYYSDDYVFDGSFFKIKQIQLGYNFPSQLLNKIDVSALRAYVSLDDFFTFTNYPGVDPEVRPGASSSMAIDFGGYPIARSVTFGLNLTF
jgi:TonB-linked SusC/RagA family outer membrane protein